MAADATPSDSTAAGLTTFSSANAATISIGRNLECLAMEVIDNVFNHLDREDMFAMCSVSRGVSIPLWRLFSRVHFMVGVTTEELTTMVGVNQMEGILYTSRSPPKALVTPPYPPPRTSY